MGKKNKEHFKSEYGSINNDVIVINDIEPTAGDSGEKISKKSKIMMAGLLLSLTFVFVSRISLNNSTANNEGNSIENTLQDSGVTTLKISNNNNNIEEMTMTKEKDDDDNDDFTTEIPFPHINRESYSSKPISSIINTDLWNPSSSSSSKVAAFPTGAFWTNLVLKSTTAYHGLSYPIMVYPYGYAWNSDVVQLSYPPSRRLHDELSIRDIFVPDLTFTTNNQGKKLRRYVKRFDPLSVTLRYEEEEELDTWWETYLVQGSPYVTTHYENIQPVLKALSIFKSVSCQDPTIRSPSSSFSLWSWNNNDIDNENCRDITPGRNKKRNNNNGFSLRLYGTRFFLSAENMNWMIVTSNPITLIYDRIHKTTITTSEIFKGVWRMALLVNNNDEDNMLTEYASVYPVGAKVSWKFPSQSIGTLQFQYQTQSMTNADNDGANNDLLMLALPHHIRAFKSSDDPTTMRILQDANLGYGTIKGNLTAVVGSIWSYNYTLPSTITEEEEEMDAVRNLDESVKIIILDQVIEDVTHILPTLDENVYGFGKQVARLAQSVHIGHCLLQNNTNSSTTATKYQVLLDQATVSLHYFITSFLDGKNSDYLVYDKDFGGLITIDGLKDFMGDFGNGWYNDHHFHYGYYLYACALLGRWNTSFVEEYGYHVDTLRRDIAASDDQKKFPLARHKSWFDGHSFASGLFPFASGKSMESSSESINGYYGAYLWSNVYQQQQQQDDTIIDFTRLLLAMEIQGVQTYWHVNKDDTIYDSTSITKNYMVGNLGMMDVTISTWFGNNPLYVHMINFMPITPITRTLFASNAYIQQEFKTIIKPIYNGVEMAWKGYVVCDKAMAIGPNEAWKDALQLRSYELDQAISQSQVLFFISTTKGFDIRTATTTTSSNNDNTAGTTATSGDTNTSSSSYCYDHSGCRELGLTGLCCPTNNGNNLGCCMATTATTTIHNDNRKKMKDDNAFCANNTPCVALQLTQGLCCPTKDGIFLGCCQEEEQHNTTNDDNKKINVDDNDSASCSNNSACAALNLTHGLCCPTNDGIFLGCCQEQQQEEDTLRDDNNEKENDNDLASCANNPTCAELNLTHGLCCPSNDGIFLGCCQKQQEQVTTTPSVRKINYIEEDVLITSPIATQNESIHDEKESDGVSSCAHNTACAKINLNQGLCCPTTDGIYLDCCQHSSSSTSGTNKRTK